MNNMAWNPLDIIFANCPDCQTPMTWKRVFFKRDLGATCCGYVYHAKFDQQNVLFYVTVRHVDLTNVLKFPPVRNYGAG